MTYQERLEKAAVSVLSSPLARIIVERLVHEAGDVLREYHLDVQVNSLSWDLTDIAVTAAAVVTDPCEPTLDLRLEVMLVMMPMAGPEAGEQEGRAVLTAGIYDKELPGVSALDRVTWATVHLPDCPEARTLRHTKDLAGALAQHVRQHYDAMAKHMVNRFCCRQLVAEFQTTRLRRNTEESRS